jgi:hypothetical protein
MTAPIDRVRHLLARAIDAAVTEEEARTCALIAAKLIMEHRMLDIPKPQPMPPMQDFRTVWQDMQDMFRQQQKRAEPVRKRRRHVEPTYPKPPREPPWWERLPTELAIMAERQCSVCGLGCEEGSVVWAHAIVDGKLLVSHRKDCRDKLPPEQRRARGPG